jgi:hypothetical protein
MELSITANRAILIMSQWRILGIFGILDER